MSLLSLSLSLDFNLSAFRFVGFIVCVLGEMDSGLEVGWTLGPCLVAGKRGEKVEKTIFFLYFICV